MGVDRHRSCIRIGYSIVIRFCASICRNRFKVYKRNYPWITDGNTISSWSVFVQLLWTYAGINLSGLQ